MTSPQYNKKQIIHSLSFASNSGFGVIFEDTVTCQRSYEQLQAFVSEVSNKVLSDASTQKYIGTDWKTVWGPVVYSHDQNSSFARADNTMGVYYSPSEKLFVIAIAGTNAISSFGWMKEDFHVNETAVWNHISGKGMGDISQGTATGLDVLINKMKDQGVDVLTALKNYITTNNITEAEVAVTGHSLGGALSPALALYLSDKRTEWNNGQKIQISTYPSAGPTIGVYPNKKKDLEKNNFIKYYNDEIDNGNIIYESTINNLDIVPLAWDKDDIAKIPTLYKSEKIKDDSIGMMALMAVFNTFKKATFKQYSYKHIKTETVSGTFDDDIEALIIMVLRGFKAGGPLANSYIPKALQTYIVNLENVVRFFVQAAYQHTKAYDKLLGIEAFTKSFYSVKNKVKENQPSRLTAPSNSDEEVITLASRTAGINLMALPKT
ncbi:MAG: hypothetical protein AAF611_22950 [Bacteroidota bacterium]